LKSLRLWLYERFHASRLLRSVYMASAKGSARRGLTIGKPVAAARGLLMGWRHAGERHLGERGRALWHEILAHARAADGSWRPVAENAFLRDWAASPEAARTRARFAAYPPEDRVRLRIPRPDSPAARPGDLLVLKAHDPATGEPGVLLVTYHDAIGFLPQVFDLAALASRYVLVLEPSTWGYMDERFLPYLGADLDVVVEAQSRPDFEFVAGLASNLAPSRLGAGDWVDPALFAPRPGTARAIDVAMVAAWDPLKRHRLLLDVLARLRARGRRLATALVGYAWTWDRAKVERLVRRRGLADQVTFHEKVPHPEVARILADARVSLLLSKREGANRAIYESWFCDTPTVVYRHHRGVNLDHAGEPKAGLLADDGELERALLDVVDGTRAFAPRAWALEHTGCHVALARLEAECRALALRRGRPWTRGLAARHAGGYLHEADRLRLAPEQERLANYLRPA
jgi:glycosyltransferase involved in cell wall biosynthesis